MNDTNLDQECSLSTREFPDFNSIDGIDFENFSIYRVETIYECSTDYVDADDEDCEEENDSDDLYQLEVWSAPRPQAFRTTARADIDRTLASIGLPASRVLSWDHTVVHQDDLDATIEFGDQESYYLVLELNRAEFAWYYTKITEAPFVVQNLEDLDLYFTWRDLPVDDISNANFLVFHAPESPLDVTGPLTQFEMWLLFREIFPDVDPNADLRLVVECQQREFSGIHILEQQTGADLSCSQLRCVVLSAEEFVVTTNFNIVLMGCQTRFLEANFRLLGTPPEPDFPDQYISADPGCDHLIFGPPDQQLFVDELIGPGYTDQDT